MSQKVKPGAKVSGFNYSGEKVVGIYRGVNPNGKHTIFGCVQAKNINVKTVGDALEKLHEVRSWTIEKQEDPNGAVPRCSLCNQKLPKPKTPPTEKRFYHWQRVQGFTEQGALVRGRYISKSETPGFALVTANLRGDGMVKLRVDRLELLRG